MPQNDTHTKVFTQAIISWTHATLATYSKILIYHNFIETH